ncbi:MAG: hypothetical protein HOJ49_00245, partial [Nitrospina sp.]|nr:hypothetical protein [Nitrospina sp.]
MKWFTLKIIFILTLVLLVSNSPSESAPHDSWSIQKVMAPFPQDTTTHIA